MIGVKLMDWNQRNPGHRITISNCHFDHISPLSLANKVGEQFKISAIVRLLQWTNVQPLPEPFNNAKSNHWSHTDHIFWEQNIYNKQYKFIYWPEAMDFLQTVSTMQRPIKQMHKSNIENENIETSFMPSYTKCQKSGCTHTEKNDCWTTFRKRVCCL